MDGSSLIDPWGADGGSILDPWGISSTLIDPLGSFIDPNSRTWDKERA